MLLTLAAAAGAQQQLSLSLADARAQALHYNRQLLNAGLSLEQAQSALWESISKGLPQVSITSTYQNYLGATANFQGMKISFGQSGSMVAQASQLVFSGAYWVGLELAKLNRQIAETSKRKTEQDVVQQVTSSVYSILVVERTNKLLQENKDNLADIYKRMQAAVNAGTATQTDADQISVQLSSVDNLIKSNDRQAELSYNMLRLQLGVDARAAITLTDNLDSLVRSDGAIALLAGQFDINANPSMQLTQQQLEAAKKQVKLQKANWLPTISGFYSYTYKYIKPQFDINPSSVVGLQASWPIFTSGGTLSKIKQAKLQVRQSQNSLEDVTDQLYIKEKQSRFNLSNAMEKLDTQTKNMSVSNHIFSDMKRKHEQGIISSIDLTTASNNLLQAESNYLNALFEVLNAKTDLEMLLNKF
jgi:outer membrane protein TolC